MATLNRVMKQRRHSRGHGRRFYTDVDMSIVKRDAAIENSRVNRGEAQRTNNRYIVVCGCGAEGCFLHGSFSPGPPMSTARPTAPVDHALAALRAIYRTARTAGTIDPQALVVAVGTVVCAGIDTTAELGAFEPYAFVWLNHLGGADGAYLCRAALVNGGWRAAIRMASLLGWTDAWSAAMTAYYGPTGTHESRCGPDGRPTTETLTEFPQLAVCMQEAAERFECILGWYERVVPATRWASIVEPKRAIIEARDAEPAS